MKGIAPHNSTQPAGENYMTGKSSTILNRLLVGGLFIVIGGVAAGCVRTEYTCVSCHTDKDTLVAVADPVTYPTTGGEG
jgi:hypothetical protein